MRRITRLVAILLAALFIAGIFFSIFASTAYAKEKTKATPKPTVSPTPTPWQSLGAATPSPTPPAVTPQPTPTPDGTSAAATPAVPAAKGDVWGSVKIPGGKAYSIYSNRSDGKGGYYYNKDYNHIFAMTPQGAQVAVIMGHNMRKSGKMFHALHHVQNAWLGKGKCERCGASCTSANKASTFDLEYDGYKKWDLVCFYETESNEPASTLSFNALSTGSAGAWLDYQLSRAGSSPKGMTVGTASAGDKLMILITCGDKIGGSTGARLYMILKAA